jgi:histone H1/5
VFIASRHASVATYLRLTLTNFNSRQAIQKYIKANNKVGNVSDAAFKSHVNRAIASGVEKGDFSQPKGMFAPSCYAPRL